MQLHDHEPAQEHHRHFHISREIIISVVAFSITLAILVFTFVDTTVIENFSHLEYIGLFLIGLLAGSITIIPIPGLVAVFAFGGILFPPFVGIIYSAGEAIGSIPIYFEGYSGSGLIGKVNNRWVLKFEKWLKERGVETIIFMSAIINPFYIPFTALAGMMHYGVVKFLLLSFLGKIIKNTIIAYLGYFGLGAILRLMGVSV